MSAFAGIAESASMFIEIGVTADLELRITTRSLP
jgi:hypothetical protein